MEIHEFSDPVLTCAEAKAFEGELLESEAAAWTAMQQAGRALALAALRDYRELREVPDRLRILALVGKGHNGGDALLACGELLAQNPRAQVQVLLAVSKNMLKPLAARALGELGDRVRVTEVPKECSAGTLHEQLEAVTDGAGFHFCLDGLTGMGFRPPLRDPMPAMVRAVNTYGKIDFRVAVDLPSGGGAKSDETLFRADFTYATGIVKGPVYSLSAAGRVRYLDLGFFLERPLPEVKERVTTRAVLNPFKTLRSADSEKRVFGHLFILGGSVAMPGALLMSVRAAVQSGVGRVTVCTPESVARSLAPQVPEAMWVGLPEGDEGTLCPAGWARIEEMLKKASALMIGPGLGQGDAVTALLKQIVARVDLPMVLDADALLPEVIELLEGKKSQQSVILTPHMGEFQRIAACSESQINNAFLLEFSAKYGVCTVLKGTHTRICDGKHVLYNSTGGPILSRGGSGDLLAGLLGGLLARPGSELMKVAAQGVFLHGAAADAWARERGQHFVATSEWLGFLAKTVRGAL
jgi:NAD(P)H-hydrate epimerase